MRLLPANVHHRRSLVTLAVTAVLDAVFGVLYAQAEAIPVLHGMYCAIGVATTSGCDIAPSNAYGYGLTVAMMLTVVPLFAAVFAFFTSGLTADHVDARTEVQTAELKEHLRP